MAADRDVKPLVPRDLDVDELAAALVPYAVTPDLVRRIFAHVQRRGPVDLTEVRGLTRVAARAITAAAAWPQLEIVERRRSEDGFVKYLFRLADGHLIEAVRIPLPDPADARALKARRRLPRDEAMHPLQSLPTAKYTICVSSQAGCALACDFCATGRLGAIRSLKTWEILDQIRLIAAETDHPIRGVVFMGMGEPLLNYENVTRAGRILSHPSGFAISGDAISISTAGVVPAIRRFTEEAPPFRLIFSLASPFAEERARLMPIEKRWPTSELVPAIADYAARTRTRATIAYVAIGGPGGNLTPAHADAIAALFAGVRFRLNLIDVTDEGGGYPAPSAAEIRAFIDALLPHKIPFVRRYSGGHEIGAACGTLSASRSGGVVVPSELVSIRTQPAGQAGQKN